MRISDWSSDVCSSDLQQGRRACPAIGPPIKPSSLSLGKRHEVLRLAIAAKCAAISPCAFLFVIRKFGGAVNRWILSCQQDFSGLGPQTMVSGKAETASEAGGWTFSRFIVEDRRIGGSGGARSSATRSGGHTSEL